MYEIITPIDGTNVPLTRAPVVVNLGAGVDSTAILLQLHQNGIRPDAIIFSWVGGETGDEHPETYTHLSYLSGWLQEVGFPPITVVRYRHKGGRYAGLSGNCLGNATLPSISFGRHGCSAKHKAEIIDDLVRKTWPGHVEYGRVGVALESALIAAASHLSVLGVRLADLARAGVAAHIAGFPHRVFDALIHRERIAATWARIVVVAQTLAALRVVRIIGFGWIEYTAVRKTHELARSCKQQGTFQTGDKGEAGFQFVYPLQTWEMSREESEGFCASRLGYVPRASSCYFCGAKSVDEILDLARTHPALARRTVVLEQLAILKMRDRSRGLAGRPAKGRYSKKQGRWLSQPRPGRWTEIYAEYGLLKSVLATGPSLADSGLPDMVQNGRYVLPDFGDGEVTMDGVLAWIEARAGAAPGDRDEALRLFAEVEAKGTFVPVSRLVRRAVS